MKTKISIFIILLLAFSACHPVKFIPLETRTITKERLVEIPVPSDSSSYYAYLKCDSMNNVLLVQLYSTKSNSINQSFVLDSNRLTVKFKSTPPPVNAKVKDSIIEREIPVPVPGDNITVFKMYWWQSMFMYMGMLALLIAIIILIVKWKKKS